jgi:Glycosyl hydrolases family 2, sugar binding domain/Glycosyl hydrolases family 2, TIM barrel domain/Glycosyl hydrolases family 2
MTFSIFPVKVLSLMYRVPKSLRTLPFLSAWLLICLWSTTPARGAVPRPEHPRPDAFRENWATLNGEWQFEIDESADGEARGLISGKALAAKIIVSFCPESKLSGIGHYGLMKHTWYRREFEVPPVMKGKRVRLHFGGVDYQAWVWVNGQPVGSHIGGGVSFNFDITRALRDGTNEVVVHVLDDTASGKQPTGKQTHTVSEGCVYTRTTGIWQPVWLEAVGSTFVENFSIVPDPDHSRVLIEVALNGADKDLKLLAEAFADGDLVGSESCPVTSRSHRLVLALSRKQLWEPGSPFLYDLKFSLTRGQQTIDRLSSYFGLRSVSIDGRSVLLNGKRVFQRLILDQGFYPDGIWTAPSNVELKQDIERSMAAGFNGARLHQKVFAPRFLYWADKLGYLVWGEFPNWGFNYRPENYANYLNEWTEVLQRDRNHPSIVGWCPFNETPAAAGELQQLVWRETKAIDPTRPVLESSGWAHTLKKPELSDDHDYNQVPANFKQRWDDFFKRGSAVKAPARYHAASSAREELGVPFMVSEFGGTFWGDAQGGWGYGSGPGNLEEFYARYEGLVNALLDNPNMFGFCYTQLTDVEQEHNGLFYYDRRPKFDLKRLHAITARTAAYEKTGPTAGPPPAEAPEPNWSVVVGAAADGNLAKPYHYTTNTPSADWMSEKLDDSTWPTGLAPFGNALPGIRTTWKTGDIWLRQSFDSSTANIKRAALVIFYDEDTEVYVNGRLIWKRSGFTTAYDAFSVTDALKKTLRQGTNTLAVHTHQTAGGQFIDLALLID